MSYEKPRIEPTPPPQWDDEALDALGAFPGGLKFVLSRWEELGGADRGTNVLGTFARYPALARGFLSFNNHVSANSSLPARDREILILRTGWLRKSEYEYYQHVILGLRAGLTENEIELIRLGPDAEGYAPGDADLVRAVDELIGSAQISDNTWENLSVRYSQEQLMDIVFCVGCYEVLAMALNSFKSPQEPGTGKLDPEISARMHAT